MKIGIGTAVGRRTDPELFMTGTLQGFEDSSPPPAFVLC